MSILDRITGKMVREVGSLGAIISSFWTIPNDHVWQYVFMAGMLLYLIATDRPKWFNWLQNFAEPTRWPQYVGLGVAMLAAAHDGSALTAGFILATIDGLFFDVLY